MSDALRAQLVASIASAALTLVEIGGEHLPISRDNADTRARFPVPLPQATGADGATRGVWVRALSADQRCKAEALAHRWSLRELGPPPSNAVQREAYMIGYERIVDRRVVVEEAAMMIVDPPDIPANIVGGWGDAVIQRIHLAGLQAEDYPAEIIAEELARLHGSPPPPPVSPEPGASRPPADGVAADPQ